MTSPITASDLWSLRRVGQPAPLPDGTAAVVPVTTYDFDTNKPTTLLHLVSADGSSTQLTTRQASSPAVSPDGSYVAFNRPVDDGPPQLHVMPLGGGEAQTLTDLPLGTGQAKWLPDGTGLIVAAPLLQGHPSVAATLDEIDAREGRHGSAIVTEDRVYRYWKRWLVGGRIHHLFHVDAGTGATTDLTPGLERLLDTEAEPIGTFDISPDGSTIALSLEVELAGRPYFQFAIHTMPVAGGELTQLMAELPAQQRRPRYSPDGSSLVFGTQIEHSYYADRIRLTRYDFDAGDAELISEDWDGSAAGWEFTGPNSIVFYAEHEGRNRLFTTNLAGATPEEVEAPDSWHGPRPAAGTIWCRSESTAHPPEVGLIDGGEAQIVSTFNTDALGAIELGRTDVIHVSGADGASIEVKLVYPPGFDPGTKWPLLHNVHGGPHGLVNEDWHWRWNTQVMAAAGYVVASVNFHGSTSWGEDFTGSIRGAWGDKTYTDVMAATDALIATGYIDEDRMAIAGGSYGGYLVTWITTQTDRFKASICHAGVTDLLGQWASDVTEGREKAVGGVPWENLRDIQRWSPMANLHKVVTPTLVVHGELDYRVVITQGLVLYGALQHKGVPSRLVYFPAEGHWIETPANAMTWWDEFLGWLDRWV